MGDLYFEYDVVFPKSINLKDGDSQILQRILGAEQKRADVVMTKTVSTPAEEDVRMEDEDVVPEDVDLQEERQKWQEQMEQAKAKGATEEDDERPHQTQCRAQ